MCIRDRELGHLGMFLKILLAAVWATSGSAEQACAAGVTPQSLARAISERMESQIEDDQPSECRVLDASGLDIGKFYAEVMQPSTPVILKRGAGAFGQLQQWADPEYLQREFGESVHKALQGFADTYVTPTGKAQDRHLEHPPQTRVKLADFLRAVREGNNRTYIEASTLFNQEGTVQPAMAKQASLPVFAGFLEQSLERVNIWVGTHGDSPKQSALHYDPLDNLMVQISGRKEFVMLEPFNSHRCYPRRLPNIRRVSAASGETRRMHPLGDGESDNFSPVLVDSPDRMEYPLFDKSHTVKCVIEAGDVLYMPAFTWHNVYSWKDPTHRLNTAVNFWVKP
eukprot:TRINITY_DN20966_c0_g1_i1.p1 TRINITY_DN20966_c0_g1~~TRINITY_DN20966_c0_g1_i1.p1  ORF type:complete len:340 (+),score=63.65 TRINITY_DN20966_c0_g1_i1:138-1157(+)